MIGDFVLSPLGLLAASRVDFASSFPNRNKPPPYIEEKTECQKTKGGRMAHGMRMQEGRVPAAGWHFRGGKGYIGLI